MPQEIHPLAAREVLVKEPDEDAIFNYDFTDSVRIDSGVTVDRIALTPSASVSPNEKQCNVSIGSITDGPFLAGEKVTLSGGAVGYVVADTADGAATIDFYSEGTAGSGETITGTKSGATATTSAIPTSVDDGVQIESSTSTGKVVQVTLCDGLRPLQGRPWREYVVTVYAIMSDGQKIPCIGRVRIPEAATADNPT